jgi:hypothetical protein
MREARKKYLTWAVSEARRKLKVRAVEYKGGKCSRCPYNKCLAALQFHHLDPKKKDFKIGGRLNSWAKLRPELEKTILLCANCHIELHDEETAARLVQQEAEVRALVPVRVAAGHGTPSKYNYWGCRCVVCRAAHAKRMREFRYPEEILSA